MTFTIITKKFQQTFNSGDVINITSGKTSECCINFGFDYVLTVEYDRNTNVCHLFNPLNCDRLLFKGQPLPSKMDFTGMCKIMIKDTDEFITIKYSEEPDTVPQNHPVPQGQPIQQIHSAQTVHQVSQTHNVANNQQLHPDLSLNNDVQGMFDDRNAAVKMKIEKRKSDIEKVRVSIIKQVGFKISELKHKISMNSEAGIFLHIALFASSIILAFGLSGYLTGLPLKDAATMIQMPINMRIVVMYSIILYAIGLALKQGICLYLQNKTERASSSNQFAEKFMILAPLLFYTGVYVINLLYYMSPKTMPFFAVFMSLFFTASSIALAVACGYFKYSSLAYSQELDKYEYREDFERVVKAYQQWIEAFINNLSNTKIQNIKDKLFMLQLKSIGETVLGILTAPFLAYGVSNTLAMCFPEAAGWIRISGLRFSPIFLVLATFLIIFAFFAFVNAFFCNKKVQASNVLKNDGFSNYLQHGVEIYGIQGVRKLDTEMRRSFIIGICIIFIEFSMNISYFMQEMGGDLNGMFLSSVAALVPTALLIAETYMLSQTKFEIYACDELIAKIDN